MTREQEIKTILQKISFQLAFKTRIFLLILLGIGILGLGLGIFSGHFELVWHALLINSIYFTGIGYAGLAFSVIFTISDAFWGRPIKRIGEAFASFIPIGTIVFFVLFFAGSSIFEWYDHDKVIHSKEAWLNVPFFVSRNVVLFLFAAWLASLYIKNSVRPDIGLARKIGNYFQNKFADRFVKNFGDSEKEIEATYHRNKKLAPILAIVYALLTSFIAFDWMMSIDQEWFSTMFGVQFTVSSLIGAGALMLVITGIFRFKFQLTEYLSINRHHDLAKLTFAFCLLWSYMIFSQVIVIWYANLPEETPFLVLRMFSLEWGWLFWVIFFMLFITPFFGLMARTACRSIWFSRVVALVILCGLWLEKYFIITPSLQENALASGHSVSHGAASTEKIAGFELLPFLVDLFVGIGFLGIFLICFFFFIQRVPLVPISDYRFFKDGHH